MTTHSVCHPGRPGPNGESQVGSPGRAFFQSASPRGALLLAGRPALRRAAN